MTLKELKEWVDGLPEEFGEYTIVNAEFTQIEDDYMYRLDKPVTMLTVSEDNKEILILNEVMDDEEPTIIDDTKE